jgi:recombinational DNA repair ATPase RecF
VVSLKLAEAEVVTQFTGERPILLLDDGLSELDANRRRALIGWVGGRGRGAFAQTAWSSRVTRVRRRTRRTS